MRALGYTQSGPIDGDGALSEQDLPVPELGPHDLLVRVQAVSVNPVDTKVRGGREPAWPFHTLGYDAAGTVERVGDAVTRFAAGDAVFYAGDLTRPGTHAEWHAVDERIVGRKPTSLSFSEAAALPLTSITAWELLFESLGVAEQGGENETLLVIGGAGGVGSILIQLARKLTQLTVIATASRSDTVEWVKTMGAHHVVNHHASLQQQVAELGLTPRYVAALTVSDQHLPAIVDLIEPRGRIAIIDDPASVDIAAMKPKALSFNWEFMFTRSMFQTDDMVYQHELLNRVATMVDDGDLVTTATRNLGGLSVETLTEAHQLQESGTVIGKTVLEGFA
ncbi:MAG: zinc-binding alcohol dehydrogenase family protein [Pseudomonadota bacterium]